MAETLIGSIERITYYNDDNGYSVIKIFPDGNYPDAEDIDGTVAVVGVMPEVVVGESAQFEGKWTIDPRYGMQFRAERTTPVMPTNEDGIVRYLSSGIVRGIGPKTAQRIVSYLGEQTLEILDHDPEQIHEVPGLKPILAENLIEVWSANRAKRQTLIHLQGYGLTSNFAMRIYEEFGNDTLQIIQSDPYRLADTMFGVGFKKADQLALGMGIETNSRERVRSGIRYALEQIAKDGSTYAPRDVLIERTMELLNISDVDRARISAVLDAQIVGNHLKQAFLTGDDDEAIDAIYLPIYYHSERGCTERMVGLLDHSSAILEDRRVRNWDDLLHDLAQQNDITLSPEQQTAVYYALTQKVSVLTGGPGTGKTTTLQMVIHAMEDIDYPYALASPTGRAAKRLSEATGRPASTIHRLLAYNPQDGFYYGEDNPLEVDMVVVDEASMVDLVLFYNLLKALKSTTHLVLVGDVDQLPSVGAGNVLRDVIDSGVAHVTRLQQIFRQDDDSHIVINAHRINQGELPVMDNKSRDFYFFGVTDPNATTEMVVDVVKNRIPNKFGYDPLEEIQVMAPMYRGGAGVDALNEALQRSLNGTYSRAEKKLGSVVYRVGDKVMQTKNNYNKDVFNGDIGYIRGIDFDDNQLEVVIDGRFIVYDFTDADELIHAYCISTHRSQGSEYSVVVLPVLTQHYKMLQRNLLYTAITRAREMVVLVGISIADVDYLEFAE